MLRRSNLLDAVRVDVFVVPPCPPLRGGSGILSPERRDDLSCIEHGGTWEPAAFDRPTHFGVGVLGRVAHIADHREPGRKQRGGVPQSAKRALRRALIQSKGLPSRALWRGWREVHSDVLVGVA